MDSFVRDETSFLRDKNKPSDFSWHNLIDWLSYYYIQQPYESDWNYQKRLSGYQRYYEDHVDEVSNGIKYPDPTNFQISYWEPTKTVTELQKIILKEYPNYYVDYWSPDLEPQVKVHKPPTVGLPDHKYLGPGNTINTGEKPIDVDDKLAYHHDYDYSNAKTFEDIKAADREFILNNLEEIKKGNYHSVISTIGISAKHLLELLKGSAIYTGSKGTCSLIICHAY